MRAAYFARHVPPEELSRVGQLASAAGLVGSVLGPLIAGISHSLPGGGDIQQRFLTLTLILTLTLTLTRTLTQTLTRFLAMAACAGLAHAGCAVALLRWMPPMEAKRRSKVGGMGPQGRLLAPSCRLLAAYCSLLATYP